MTDAVTAMAERRRRDLIARLVDALAGEAPGARVSASDEGVLVEGHVSDAARRGIALLAKELAR